jgi:flagellar biosynthesis/type III secretory pathway protein FliH
LLKARIIKGQDEPTAVGRKRNPERARLVSKAEQHAEAQARAIRQQAEFEARRIREDAQTEAAAITDGVRQQAEAAAAERLLEVQRRAEKRAASMLDELRQDLTRLGVMIAEKLLGEQLRVAPESVARIVAEVLKAAEPCRRVVLRVHPDDRLHVEPRLPELRQGCGIEQLVVESDPSISRGGCVLESVLGQVDGRLETQLATIGELIARGDQ